MKEVAGFEFNRAEENGQQEDRVDDAFDEEYRGNV